MSRDRHESCRRPRTRTQGVGWRGVVVFRTFFVGGELVEWWKRSGWLKKGRREVWSGVCGFGVGRDVSDITRRPRAFQCRPVCHITCRVPKTRVPGTKEAQEPSERWRWRMESYASESQEHSAESKMSAATGTSRERASWVGWTAHGSSKWRWW